MWLERLLLLDLLSVLNSLGHVCTFDQTAEGLDDDAGDLVWVTVGGGTPVLEVALALLGDGAVDTNGSTTVGDAPGELLVRGSLVPASHTSLVALTVDKHVLLLPGSELLHGGLNGLDATFGTHLLGGDVGVETGTVPVTGDGLRGEGDLDAKVLGNAVEKETRDPELVAHCERKRIPVSHMIKRIIGSIG